jgi:hypothetical protein
MDGTAAWLADTLRARARPNGTFTLNVLGHGLNGFGHYTEQFAASMAASELLLQSAGDVIRVFPAWPRPRRARFHQLRSQGGFLVSASHDGRRVQELDVVSTAGGELRLLSPWPRPGLRRAGETEFTLLRPDARKVVRLKTRPGERIEFRGLPRLED